MPTICMKTSPSSGRMGVDRHQIIEAVGLDAMAGKIKQRDVGADQFGAEFLQGGVEAGLVEVELRAAADHEKAERQQRIRHQLGVGRRDSAASGRSDRPNCRSPARHAFRHAPAGAGAKQKCRENQSRHDAGPAGHDDALPRAEQIPPSPLVSPAGG